MQSQAHSGVCSALHYYGYPLLFSLSINVCTYKNVNIPIKYWYIVCNFKCYQNKISIKCFKIKLSCLSGSFAKPGPSNFFFPPNHNHSFQWSSLAPRSAGCLTQQTWSHRDYGIEIVITWKLSESWFTRICPYGSLPVFKEPSRQPLKKYYSQKSCWILSVPWKCNKNGKATLPRKSWARKGRGKNCLLSGHDSMHGAWIKM